MESLLNALADRRLQWWQWCQVAGFTLPPILLALGVQNVLVWALIAHLVMDFIVQTDETSARKQRELWPLVHHAIVSGGYPGLIAGGLPGLAVSIIIHMVVDSTNKFGLRSMAGAMLDQAAHVATVTCIYLVF